MTEGREQKGGYTIAVIRWQMIRSTKHMDRPPLSQDSTAATSEYGYQEGSTLMWSPKEENVCFSHRNVLIGYVFAWCFSVCILCTKCQLGCKLVLIKASLQSVHGRAKWVKKLGKDWCYSSLNWNWMHSETLCFKEQRWQTQPGCGPPEQTQTGEKNNPWFI